MPRTRKSNGSPRKKGRRTCAGQKKAPPLPDFLEEVSLGGYQRGYAKQAFTACAEGGLGQEELARLFDVGSDSIKNWNRKYPEFRLACQAGKDYFDAKRVEGALLQRALGYEFEEVSIEDIELMGKIPQGGSVSVPGRKIRRTTKHYSPNVQAAMYWLQNRNPQRWRVVRHEIEAILSAPGTSDQFGDPGFTKKDISQDRAAEVYTELLRGGKIDPFQGSEEDS